MSKKNKNYNLLPILFDEYCEWRYKEVKGNDQYYNYCSEQFAKTELFQFNLEQNKLKELEHQAVQYNKNTKSLYVKDYDKYSLPFERQFIKISETKDFIVTIFIGEFKPKVITGTVMVTYLNLGTGQCTGFSIDENGEVAIQTPKNMPDETKKAIILLVTSTISITLETLIEGACFLL